VTFLSDPETLRSAVLCCLLGAESVLPRSSARSERTLAKRMLAAALQVLALVA
jgi:hypothetical protein